METNKKFGLPQWLVMTLAIGLSIFVIILCISQIYAFTKNFRNSKPQNTISVSAEGSISAIPDLATVTIGIVSTGKTAALASTDNNENAETVINFIKQQSIEPKDTATTGYNVYPNYDYTKGSGTITGYTANQTITVKIRNVDKSTAVINKILSGAVLSGSNQLQGVALSFADADNLRQEARKQAIEKAKAKAAELAESTGLKLIKIVSISEGAPNYPTPMPYPMGMGGGGIADSKSAAIEPGNQDITASITVTFEVK